MQTLEQSIRINKHTRYQDTGIEWLQELPAHWKIGKGKWLFVKQERPPRKGDDIVTCFRDGQVTLRNNRKTEGFTNALKEHGYQGIRKGDLVIHNMDAFAGAIGISDSDGKSTPVYSACIPRTENTVDPHYYAYFLRNLAKMGFIESLAKGIRERSTDFRFNDFGILLLPVPPKPEQTLIARFLDRKTVQIDKAIAQKEKLIELLKERRQILIHNAVTKGLNPNVKMKDSEVEWIGEIPEHWEVKKIKYLGRIINGYAFSSDEFVNEGVRVMKISNIQTMELDWTDESYISEKYYEKLPGFRINKDDLVFALTRPIISTGIKASLVEIQEKILLNQRNAVLKPTQGIYTKWLYYIILDSLFTQSFDREIDKTGQQPNISSRNIGELRIPYAQIDEQKKIIVLLEGMLSKIHQSIALHIKAIDRLKEYKSTLINSAVTGKIKVPDLETMD